MGLGVRSSAGGFCSNSDGASRWAQFSGPSGPNTGGASVSERKPVPIIPLGSKAVCPVCHKPSYSRGGMHPQCALARADAKTRAALKAKATTDEKRAVKKPWAKICPKCKRQIPSRRMVCDCGQELAVVHPKSSSTAVAAHDHD